MSSLKLSIVIVNYNTRALLRACLDSISRSTDRLSKEIIVVDNGSRDQSPAMVRRRFPRVKIVAAGQNLGYAAGNNLGLRAAAGQLILLLNSDTQLAPETLDIMVRFMDRHPRVGLSTCAVKLPGGRLDPASHRGFPTPWTAFTYFSGLEKLFPRSRLFGGYHQGWKDLSRIHQIDSPAGAFFLTRKSVLDQVGLLDEKFFIYAEDLDLALRIKQAGWQVMYVPSTSIIHFKKQSGRNKTASPNQRFNVRRLRTQTSQHFFQTMRLFYDKHYLRRYPFPLRWLVSQAINLISLIKR